MICKDDALSALDRKMAKVYTKPPKKLPTSIRPCSNQSNAVGSRAQRLLEKRRQAQMRRRELPPSHRELQARYRLVPAKGPTTYVCNGDPRNEVVVTFSKPTHQR